MARALKERNPNVRIALSDPMGSALFNWFARGELKAEGNSVTEGIGQGRVTANLEGTPIDMAYQITDEEALPVLFDLIEHEVERLCKLADFIIGELLGAEVVVVFRRNSAGGFRELDVVPDAQL